MHQHRTSYPVRAVSRAVIKKRAAKLRFTWLLVGAGFGVGCVVAMINPFSFDFNTTPSVEMAVEEPATPAAAETPPQEVALIDETGAEVGQQPVPAETASAQDQYPLTLALRVENGDTMITLLTDAGVAHDEAYNIVQAMGKNFDPKKLGVGKSVSVVLEKAEGAAAPTIARMVMPTSLTSSIEITRGAADGFSVKKVDAPVERKYAHVGGRIDSSLYETGTKVGIPAALLSEIITAYSYDVDFQRDIRQGDAVDVLYERMETKEGAVAGYGSIIFAELELGGRPMKIYRYVDKQGNSDYYNEKGESVRKALLRTPINGARITSGFGMRNHPLLGYSKMHRGVDFGAPTGTPIYAAGDGTVEIAAAKNGYGNYLRLRHNNSYATAYAHISRFASGIAPGRKVKQGQIVAYVGSTGMSTGPHLHYEVLVNNAQVNPSSVKFKTGTVLKGTELASFRKTVQQIETQLAAIPRGGKVLAMANLDNAPLKPRATQ